MSCPTGLFFILWLFSATQPNKVKCLRCFSVPCDCAIRRHTAYPGRLPAAEWLTPAFPLFGSLWLTSGPAYLHQVFCKNSSQSLHRYPGPQIPALQPPCRPPERLRPGVRGGSGTSARTDFAGLRVGEGAGKPASDAGDVGCTALGSAESICTGVEAARGARGGGRFTPPLPSSSSECVICSLLQLWEWVKLSNCHSRR